MVTYDLSIMNQDSQNWFRSYDTITTSYIFKHHLFYFIDSTFDYMKTAIVNFVNQAVLLSKKYLQFLNEVAIAIYGYAMSHYRHIYMIMLQVIIACMNIGFDQWSHQRRLLSVNNP